MLSRFSYVRLFASHPFPQWTIAHQAPLSMGFFWQEYWSGLSCLPHVMSGHLPDPGIQPLSLILLH